MNISTTCHNAELIVLTVDDGSRFESSSVADEILCAEVGCNNSWTATGVSKTAGVANIVTTCHGTELITLTVDDGSRFDSSEVSEILCAEVGCNNSWTATGVATRSLTSV